MSQTETPIDESPVASSKPFRPLTALCWARVRAGFAAVDQPPTTNHQRIGTLNRAGIAESPSRMKPNHSCGKNRIAELGNEKVVFLGANRGGKGFNVWQLKRLNRPQAPCFSPVFGFSGFAKTAPDDPFEPRCNRADHRHGAAETLLLHPVFAPVMIRALNSDKLLKDRDK